MKINSVIDVSDLHEQVKELRKRLLNESDLGGVLISTSFLDACLASLLQVHFVQSSVTDKLLNPTSGTLGTFSSKCDVAYCLNLIIKETYKDLILIGQIRNIFAHNHLKSSFEDKKVHEICSKLNFPTNYLQSSCKQSNYSDVEQYFENPKNRFIYTVNCISDLLLKSIISKKSKKNAKTI